MLNTSRLYSFLDRKNNILVHFLDGQKIIEELVIQHNLNGNLLSYYRDTVLSALLFQVLIKPGETLGVYLDNEKPYMRFKMELWHTGDFRTLLMPSTLTSAPKELSGLCRIVKITQNQEAPYSSIIKLENTPTNVALDELLEKSYQNRSKIILAGQSDQSVLVSKMPEVNVDKMESDENLSLQEYLLSIQKNLNEIFDKALNDVERVVNSFEELGFDYLSSKEIKFYCPCSHENMVTNLITLSREDREEIFSESNDIDINCDYCNTQYKINKKELYS